jgi:hypothetical protein
MKANELRIGNIIKLSESNEIFMAYEICSSGFRVRNKNEDTWIEEWQFEGIELTEELFLKFGFFKKARLYFLYKDLKITVSDGKFYFFTFHFDVELKYVHQLQNLYFALTGEELTI